MMRQASCNRKTAETEVGVTLNLDGTGLADIATGIGFFDHMLTQLARHALFDLTISAEGDRHIDDHHTVEDVGIVLGQAFATALGDKRGIARYGSALLPMDEALTRCAVDLSGRPFLVCNLLFHTAKIGTFDTQLIKEWFRAFAFNAGLTLHIETLYAENDHHGAESAFKALARALAMAAAIDPRQDNRIPSTKGSL